MEIRESEILEVRADAREVVGLAVPYGQVAEVRAGGYKERFEIGSIEDNSEGPVYYRHDYKHQGLAIGYIKEASSSEQGLKVVARIHKGPKGDQVLNQVASGQIKGFSVGFSPIEQRDEDGVVVRTKVSLLEVSLAELPIYGATLLEVRENNKQKEDDEQIMSEEFDKLSSENAELRESVAELDRKVSVLDNKETIEVRSDETLADAVVAAYNGKDASRDALQVRAYTGGSTADNALRPIWVDKELNFIEKRRPLSAVFGHDSIPGDSGTTIEYAKVATRTGSVAKQTAEGEPLTYNKVTITTDSAPIETFGGYAELSVQALRFGKAPLLNTTLKHLSVEYAKATEAKVASTLTGIANANLNVVARGAVTGASAASGWIGAVEDSLVAIDDNSRGLAGSHIIVSRDVHKALLTTVDTTGRPLFVVNGDGSNTYGSVTAGAAGSAAIAGLPVVSGPNLAAGSFYVVSNEAILVWESSIFELSDANIVNLTELRSLYGYLAAGVYDGKGIAKVTWS
ncbi:phage major capsid protein [Rhodococcus sp. 05-2255-1e]|uniref:phage major capsid protein n=1 Tax=Rhodococcus sp. 05-2255-1e TaxID=2022495 RepID=UPI000B9C694D|nr:phage major capsid protein [Rhodococcus sp. 05-2255-1e]OZE25669.1 phage major capsid protein [Rhodococcus sp. 05-2255-1e]